MNKLDEFRCLIMRHISTVNSFRNGFPVWAQHFNTVIAGNPTGANIFALGEHISDAFQSRAMGLRTQETVSGGGAAWECLIVWYLNLVFWGTNVVAAKQNRNFIPSVISDALCVTISNHQTNTESDIIVYSVPLNLANGTETINLNMIDEQIKLNITSELLSVIQCKTNWNDNSQIPMLWDLIYNAQNINIPNVNVGINGVRPHSFRRFSYSFVTVPTTNDVITQGSVKVLRVKNLSGGNYWGKPSSPNIISCINEYFGSQFGGVFNGTIQTHINNQLAQDPNYFTRFITNNY